MFTIEKYIIIYRNDVKILYINLQVIFKVNQNLNVIIHMLQQKGSEWKVSFAKNLFSRTTRKTNLTWLPTTWNAFNRFSY